jgi:hypothetical protein
VVRRELARIRPWPLQRAQFAFYQNHPPYFTEFHNRNVLHIAFYFASQSRLTALEGAALRGVDNRRRRAGGHDGGPKKYDHMSLLAGTEKRYLAFQPVAATAALQPVFPRGRFRL